ncbi:hypothetical protein WA026_023099 [Henosepilachna vigintioctopunctata]|uniref:Acyltransferase 3 domain-containing protein n=1 Tax=Henosepilachna vigintioctopunctata TaxID=420089 RepID=A0AAW1UDF0_9CUCU
MSLGIVVLPGLWIFSKSYYDSFWFSLPYFLFNTTIFGLGIITALIGFTKGIGWMAKWCVEWDPLYILGRLSYSCFLVHYTICVLKLGSSTSVNHADDLSIFFETMELLMSSFFFALILTLTVEMPVTALQSTFMKKNAESKSKKTESGTNKNNEMNQRLKKS